MSAERSKIQQPSPEKQSLREYSAFLKRYQSSVKKIKTLQKRYPVPGDTEIMAKLQQLEKDRHEIHLQLLEKAKLLSKNDNDVLIDIIRQNRTLESYGLPEFSILTSEDIAFTGYWHELYMFNVDARSRLPSSAITERRKRDIKRSLKFYERRQTDDEERVADRPRGIESDEVMLVFSIVPVSMYGRFEDEPDDYSVRVNRAENLAKELNTDVFEERDSDYHVAEAKVLGVCIRKTELERVVSLIRDNPERFRLGDQFYSAKDREEIEQFSKDMKVDREKYAAWALKHPEEE